MTDELFGATLELFHPFSFHILSRYQIYLKYFASIAFVTQDNREKYQIKGCKSKLRICVDEVVNYSFSSNFGDILSNSGINLGYI